MAIQPSETTASNQIAQALKDTLATNLGSYITLPTGFSANSIYLQSAIWMQAVQSPAICIDDRGDSLRTQCAAGMNAAGVTSPGFQLKDYKFDIEVWIEAREAEFARTHLNIWRDAIEALLNDYETLDDKWVAVTARQGEPAIEGVIGSKAFWGAVVHCDIVAGTFRGELALAEPS